MLMSVACLIGEVQGWGATLCFLRSRFWQCETGPAAATVWRLQQVVGLLQGLLKPGNMQQVHNRLAAALQQGVTP